ncbi:cold-shock protein [Xanthobacter autotrophicus DSM 431]|uniref:cold-shock protein n=1 Tax=Xanthobacter nonsaccharivorans TaxID=3119912 RepID=UPI003728CD2A
MKWFNPEKGFGFVELSDGSGDVFLHARALEAAGQESVPPGSKLSVRVGQGQKGRQVTEVLEVDTSTAEAAPPRRSSFGDRPSGGGFGAPRAGAGGPRAATGPTEERVGTVKWYNPDKGFGFIAVEGGGKDVFVHVTVISRSGLSDLAEGQRVVVQVGQGPKGPEARGIELAD